MSLRAANANRPRDTPGRLLLAWVMLLTPLILSNWRVHLHPSDFDWVEYPTALGDDRFYKLMDADLYAPNLQIGGRDEGLYRRDLQPQARDDEAMMKAAKDESNSWFIYTSARPEESGRVFLKSDHGRYIEFGERAHYEPFVPPASAKNP